MIAETFKTRSKSEILIDIAISQQRTMDLYKELHRVLDEEGEEEDSILTVSYNVIKGLN